MTRGEKQMRSPEASWTCLVVGDTEPIWFLMSYQFLASVS